MRERRKEGTRETVVREDRQGDNKRKRRTREQEGREEDAGEGGAVGVSELSNSSSKGPPQVTSSDSAIPSPAPGLACNCACLSLPEWPFLGRPGPAMLLSMQLIASYPL